MMKIVLDAMGSDRAPEAEIKGAVMAVRELGHDVVLVGDETIIKEELKKYKWPSDKISVIHAPERIEMREAAAISVRRKRHSSIVVWLELLKNKEADGFVSAGNTGAVVCAAVLSLRLLPG
ncbi:MAG: phosphate--acyl-ACP acyltransferase, partial [Candidatus Omnitrophica bacterium]|nr:phosphate--acyl-ACP acyltransferase [Candidatus Omnitrophota bacterium]